MTVTTAEEEGRPEEVLMAIDFSALLIAFLNSIIWGKGDTPLEFCFGHTVAIKINTNCCSSCHDTRMKDQSIHDFVLASPKFEQGTSDRVLHFCRLQLYLFFDTIPPAVPFQFATNPIIAQLIMPSITLRSPTSINPPVKQPVIGWGTWRITEASTVATLLPAALSTGFRHIDSAAVYENEKQLGEVLNKEIDSGRDQKRRRVHHFQTLEHSTP